MKLRIGITDKLFGWFFLIVVVFYGTIFVLYTNVQQIVKISENIVSKNNEISSASQKLVENLHLMEENDKKYRLLRKDEYLNAFIAAQKEFERHLDYIIKLDSAGPKISSYWKGLYESYHEFSSNLGDLRGYRSYEALWIPESIADNWVRTISLSRMENEYDVFLATKDLNRLGEISVRNGLVGLGVLSLVGLIGVVFLAYTMIRPLRDLQKGIRSISKERFSEPIRIRSKDEFGELAGTFNELAIRLKEEEEMRADFISMLSHEIRTPLTSIRESVNMIVEEVMGSINDRQRKFLEIASSEIGRICDLLNLLMKASLLGPGALKIEPQSIDTNEFVSRCVFQVTPLADAKNMTIDLQVSTDIPHVTGDQEHLQQVLLNLLGNAIKFSDSNGNVIVQVQSEKDSKHVNFSISDDGPGIPETELSRIFDKYYQAHGMRERMDGVGLGLNIAKRIIEAHESTLWVKSEVGKGSEFGFSLPRTS